MSPNFNVPNINVLHINGSLQYFNREWLKFRAHGLYQKLIFKYSRIGPHISCIRIGRPTLEIYKSLTDI
jgi:hypothetical protein